VIEVHPEVCFAALAGWKPMVHRKSTPEGREERLAWLSRWLPQSAALSKAMLAKHPRAAVQEDDILDALVVLLVARADEAQLRFLPPHIVRDERGLPMRMVYWERG
jgi:predicted RNase H-like nuclease